MPRKSGSASPATATTPSRSKSPRRPNISSNGRPLPEFGYEPLLALVREELDRNY